MKVKEIISLVLICTMTLVLGTTTFALERSEPTGIASIHFHQTDVSFCRHKRELQI